MPNLAAEVARTVKCRLRRVPGNAWCGDHSVVHVRLAVRERDNPLIVGGRFRAHNGHAELDVVVEPELVCERADVITDLFPRRVVGVIGRHRVADETRGVFRTNEMRAFVHRAARVLHVPDTADVCMALVPIETDAFGDHRARHDKPCRPSPHQTVRTRVGDVFGREMCGSATSALRLCESCVRCRIASSQLQRHHNTRERNCEQHDRRRVNQRICRAGQNWVMRQGHEERSCEADETDHWCYDASPQIAITPSPEECNDGQRGRCLQGDDA